MPYSSNQICMQTGEREKKEREKRRRERNDGERERVLGIQGIIFIVIFLLWRGRGVGRFIFQNLTV